MEHNCKKFISIKAFVKSVLYREPDYFFLIKNTDINQKEGAMPGKLLPTLSSNWGKLDQEQFFLLEWSREVNSTTWCLLPN